MINDNLKVTGNLDITLYDADHNIKQVLSIPNLVVTAGKNLIASRLVNATGSVMSHMALGDSSMALTAANTALGNQLDVRQALTSTTVTNNTVTYSATFGAGAATGTIIEAGIFNDATSGTMLCRTTFAAINKEATDVLTINWNVVIN